MAEPTGQRSNRDDALAIVRRLREAGHVAYFAGGCVRDMLLGLDPKDYDIATDAPPPRVREIFMNTQAVGAAFGVILVRHGKSVIEVATFRTDLKYVDGRRPEGVVFTTAEEDAKRRDFTINGMFFDPIENRVIDFVGGHEDLKNKVLRAIGEPNHRFEEDHLRLLRAVRFAARFELEIEATTAAAINKHAEHLKRISPERIADELRGALTLPEQGGDWAWYALFKLFPKLSDAIFRFVGEPPSLEARKRGNVFQALTAHEPFGLALAAASIEWMLAENKNHTIEHIVSRPVSHRVAHALRQALRISNDEVDDMLGSMEGVSILLTQHPLPIATAKRFLARPSATLSRRLLDAVVCSAGAHRVQRLNEYLDGLAKTDVAPPPLITGDDLTAAGLQPGPVFKRILDAVYDEQLEGRLTDKDQALQFAKRLASEQKR